MADEEKKKVESQEGDELDLEAQIAAEIAEEAAPVEEAPVKEKAEEPASEPVVEEEPQVVEVPIEEPVPEPTPAKEPTPEPDVEIEEPTPESKPDIKEEATSAPEPAVEEKAEKPAPEPAKEEPAKEGAPVLEPKTPVEAAPDEPATKEKPAPTKTAPGQAAETSADKLVEEKVRGPKKVVGLPPEKILLFGKYNMAEVSVQDPGLAKYLNLDPIIVAHTGAKHANRSFGKTKMHIIERLVNNMMRTEKFTGKKQKSYKVVKNAFEIIEKRTKSHPVQVLIDAIENSAPREEITRLRYGGISVPKAVDTSSSRRLDLAFRNLTRGAINSSYKSAKSIDSCLANELMLAAKKDMNSFAVSKKEEIERIAASAR